MLSSLEEILDWQHERVDIYAHARTAYSGLLQKRQEKDLGWIVPCIPSVTQSVKGLNWTEVNCKLEVTQYQRDFPEFTMLTTIALVIPVSSGPCEQEFSIQNCAERKIYFCFLDSWLFIITDGPQLKGTHTNAVIHHTCSENSVADIPQVSWLVCVLSPVSHKGSYPVSYTHLTLPTNAEV